MTLIANITWYPSIETTLKLMYVVAILIVMSLIAPSTRGALELTIFTQLNLFSIGRLSHFIFNMLIKLRDALVPMHDPVCHEFNV